MTARSEKVLTVLSRLEFYFFIGFSFFLIPLSYCPGKVDPGLSIHFCLLAALVAALAIVRCIRQAMFPREQGQGIPRIFTVFVTGYFFVCCLSIIPSTNTSESVFEIAKVFLFVSFLWFASTMIRRCFDRIHFIAHAVMVSSLIISLLGIFEYWGVFSFFDNGNVGPGVTMINRNLLSSFLFLSLGFVLFVIFAARRRIGRVLGFFAYAAILYLFFAAQTRAVWLGCLGGLLCTIIILSALRFPLLLSFLRAQKRIISVCALLPVIMIVAVSFWKPAKSDLSSFAQRAATIVDPTFESNNQRIILWRKTIRMSMEHPFLGVGAGNWKIVLPRYGISDLLWPDMIFIETRPYNDFLWVLAETGIFGLVAYAGLFFLSALFCLRSLRNSHDRTIALCAVLLLFSLIGFAIISFFDFPRERVEHMTLFAVILAVCASMGAASLKPVINESTRIPWLRFAATLASLLCASACLWVGVERLRGDIHGSTMRGLWQKQEWQKAIAEADRASSIFYTMEPTSTPVRWYRGVANFKLGNIDQAFLDYRRAYAYHPWHVQVLNDLGTCYSLKGDQKRAMACYSDALAILPLFEPTLINLAVIYYNLGQYDQAYSYITKCNSPHMDSRFESYFKIISQKTNKRE